MNKENEDSFPLFKTIKKLDFYSVNEINDREPLETFVEKLANLQKVTSAIEKNFNPFTKLTKRIPQISLVTPDD